MVFDIIITSIMKRNKKIVTETLSGFTELLPAEQIVFNTMLDTIRRVYENFGFVPIDTPVLERADVLLAKAGGETEKQIYQFKKGDTDLAMRFDLTIPLARYVAEHYNELTFPFRRYAIGKVYRGEKPQAGRFREFYQCDIDVIGDTNLDLRFDAEIPSIIYMIFRELGFAKFTVRINNRKLFNGLFFELGVTESSTRIMQSIDRLEKNGIAAVQKNVGVLGLTGCRAPHAAKPQAVHGGYHQPPKVFHDRPPQTANPGRRALFLDKCYLSYG